MFKKGDHALGEHLSGWSQYNGYLGVVIDSYIDGTGNEQVSWLPFRDNPERLLRRDHNGNPRPISGISGYKLKKI